MDAKEFLSLSGISMVFSLISKIKVSDEKCNTNKKRQNSKRQEGKSVAV